MIRAVFFKKSSGDYEGFQISGHAGYAEYGKDIICAAVSVLAQNTVNSIDALTDDSISVDVDERKGELKMKFAGKPGAGSVLLMNSLVLGIQSIAEDNKSYIHLDFKEV